MDSEGSLILYKSLLAVNINGGNKLRIHKKVASI